MCNALFRQSAGSSVRDYIRARRMAHVRLLLSSGMPAAQAAVRVGYTDYTTFYRTYVRSFGHPPSADSGASEPDTLLKQALSASPGDAEGIKPVLFPVDGTENEDPSMVNAVLAEDAL